MLVFISLFLFVSYSSISFYAFDYWVTKLLQANAALYNLTIHFLYSLYPKLRVTGSQGHRGLLQPIPAVLGRRLATLWTSHHSSQGLYKYVWKYIYLKNPQNCNLPPQTMSTLMLMLKIVLFLLLHKVNVPY